MPVPLAPGALPLINVLVADIAAVATTTAAETAETADEVAAVKEALHCKPLPASISFPWLPNVLSLGGCHIAHTHFESAGEAL